MNKNSIQKNGMNQNELPLQEVVLICHLFHNSYREHDDNSHDILSKRHQKTNNIYRHDFLA